MTFKQLSLVQGYQPDDRRLLDRFAGLYARVSCSFRQAGASQSCVQVCTDYSACDDTQGVPFDLHLPKFDNWASSTDANVDYSLVHSLQGSQHLFIEGGAAHPCFSVALRAALDTVADAVPYSRRLPKSTCIFDDVCSTKQLQYSLDTTLEPVCHGTLEADGLLKNQLIMYIRRMELEELERFPAYSNSIRAFNQEMFDCLGEDALLLAKLNVERLYRILGSQPVLENQPVPLSDLHEMVKWLLESIPYQSRRYTVHIFAWLLWANRPLYAAEMSAALRIGWTLPLTTYPETPTDHLAIDDFKNSVASLSGGLVTVADDHIVCFIDESVRQYFLGYYSQSENRVCPVSYQAAQELLALSCLRCLIGQLKLNDMEAPAQDSHVGGYSLPIATGLLQYARAHWSQHCRSAEASSYYVVGTIQEYLYQSIVSRPHSVSEENEPGRSLDLRNPILRECARNGFIELGTMYLEMGAEVNDKDFFSGIGPLALALSNQHWNMAAILIRKGASIRYDLRADRNNFLHDAAAYGREDIVAFLLNQGADPNLMTSTAEMPFHSDVMRDQPGAVESLADVSGHGNSAPTLSKPTLVYSAANFDNSNSPGTVERMYPTNTYALTQYRLAANGRASNVIDMAKLSIDEQTNANKNPRAHTTPLQISNGDNEGIHTPCGLGICDEYRGKHHKVGILLPLC